MYYVYLFFQGTTINAYSYHISGLTTQSADDLRNHFSQFGTVDKVDMEQCEGAAYIEFSMVIPGEEDSVPGKHIVKGDTLNVVDQEQYVMVGTQGIVYGAICRKNGPCEYFCYTLIFWAIFPLQTLPYQNRVVGNFSHCMHGCHFKFKMADLYSFLQGSKNQVEKYVILFV